MRKEEIKGKREKSIKAIKTERRKTKYKEKHRN